MVGEQADFAEALDDLENIVKGFAQYTDMS